MASDKEPSAGKLTETRKQNGKSGERRRCQP